MLFTACLSCMQLLTYIKFRPMEKLRKIILSEKEMPGQWYNIMADMPNKPLPPLNPVTRQPVGPEDLSAIFPMELIKQEVSTERYIDIPEEVRDLYHTYRPSPLFRAVSLEKALGTKSKIYYKYEGGNYSGSHKANTAIAQAYYNKQEGIKRIMNVYNARFVPSQSKLTEGGRNFFEIDPESPGSLGIAISEAIEVAVQ